MKIIIYGLVDPENNKIRYVGKTYKRDMKRRLNQHLTMRGQNHHKDNWIEKLLSQGRLPEMVILEECDENNWQEKEIEWIKKTPKLTNYTKGGSGVIPPSGTKHFNSKISKKVVRKIIYLYKHTTLTIHGLARLLNVSHTIISHITQGESWKEYTNGEKITPLYSKRKGKYSINSGSKHPHAKLTENDIIDIREKYKNGVTKAEIAREYNVSFANIYYILLGKTWTHVKD